MSITPWKSSNAVTVAGVLEAVARLSKDILDCPVCAYRIVATTKDFTLGEVHFPSGEFHTLISLKLVSPESSLVLQFNDTRLLNVREGLATYITEIHLVYTVGGKMSEHGRIRIACSNGETIEVPITISEFRFSEIVVL